MPSSKGLFFYIFNGIIVITPLVLILLPVDTFDQGTSICLSKLLAGIECFACGMTRSIMHMIHLDFAGAWGYNKMAFIVAPLLFPMWLKSLILLLGKPLPYFMAKYM